MGIKYSETEKTSGFCHCFGALVTNDVKWRNNDKVQFTKVMFLRMVSENTPYIKKSSKRIQKYLIARLFGILFFLDGLL